MEDRVFKRALITGISGAGGSYLAEHIVQNYPEVEVHGIVRWHSTSGGRNLAQVENRICTHECDLLDFSSVLNTLKETEPDVIFHLASHANVRTGFTTPLSVIQNNVMGTANLFEAIRSAELNPIVQLCSTSEVYGQVNTEDIPITEDCPMRPSSPYAVSKSTQDHLGYAYWRCYELQIIRTRMFAYFNPRRSDLFSSSFARQIALIEAGKKKELVHGNLNSVRTMIDVRDAMRAYWDAVMYCKFGAVYNIGGSTTITVGEFLEALKNLAQTEIPTRLDEALLRPGDVTLQIPDSSLFVEVTGWKEKYSFEESVHHLLNYWRKHVSEY